MINLLEIINDSTNSKVLKTIDMFPTDETETFWRGTVQLCGKGLQNNLTARKTCAMPKSHKKQAVFAFKSSVLKADALSKMTIKLPEEAIPLTRCKLYISDKKIILQMVKSGEKGPQIVRQQIATSNEITQTKRSSWKDNDTDSTIIGKETEPDLEKFLMPISAVLRERIAGNPPNNIYKLLKQSVHQKTCEVLSELAARSSNDGKYAWRSENQFQQKLIFDSDPLTNEVIRRCIADILESNQKSLISITEVDENSLNKNST